jgi:hypothetical protein
MLATATSSDVVTIRLSPNECKSLLRLGQFVLAGEPAAESLLSKLEEAETLALWLRDYAAVELDRTEAHWLSMLRERDRARPTEFATSSVGNMTVAN